MSLYNLEKRIGNKEIIKSDSKQVLILTCLIAIFSLPGCTDKQKKSGYQKEAKAVCDVFNPVHWKNLAKNIEPYELQEKLTQKLSAALKSNEMRKIIKSIPEKKIEIRYAYYVDSVSKLIGERHECPDMENYLTID